MQPKKQKGIVSSILTGGRHGCEVLEAKTEVLSENTPIPVAANTVKVPVVLAETKVQVDVESLIRLPEPALEIKRIKKKVIITQCKFPPTSDKLFLKGYVRKNIEYATLHSDNGNDCVAGLIKHVTVDVPFECVTKIAFMSKPWLPTTVTEFEVVDENWMQEESSEVNLVVDKHLNEKIFCELVSLNIKEVDMETCQVACTSIGEYTFEKIKEKMEINLVLKILQYQQVPLFMGTPKKNRKHNKHHC